MSDTGPSSFQTLSEGLETGLGYHFKDSRLLRCALTHPSFSAENKEETADNQRLEFLGDAVLQLVVTEELYASFPEEGEGKLTKWRAQLVSKSALARYGKGLRLGSAILMGRGEELSGGRGRDSNLADGVEALLGAVYLDGGFEEARRVVLGLVGEALLGVTQSPETGNPKGELQEVLQALEGESPVYTILSEDGPDHKRVFRAAVTWKNFVLGEGEGASKKAAETQAAAEALIAKGWLSRT